MQTDEPGAYIEALRRNGQLVVDSARALASAPGDGASFDSMVPTCPEWTVRELIRHLGRVHRWAGTYVAQKRTEPMTPDEEEQIWGQMPEDADLAAWYADGHSQLVNALATAPSDLDCWSFLPAPTPLTFWARRQAHETAIHRVDVQGAIGAVDMGGGPAGLGGGRVEIEPAFADDGVDELLTLFYGRPNRVRSDIDRVLAVIAEDTGGTWLVRFGPHGARGERAVPDNEEPDCTLTGQAGDLYLGLWNRAPLTRVDVTGDPSLLDLWREKARVRWS